MRITIYIPQDLLKQIDADEETRTKGRSAFIMSAVRFYWRLKREATHARQEQLKTARANARRLAQIFQSEAYGPCGEIIHIVTGVRFNKGKPERSRSLGWYSSFAEAERMVLLNELNLFEDGYYNLAVIESMPAGVYPMARRVAWYRAAYKPGSKDPTVSRTRTPSVYRRVVNFGMG